MRYTDLLLVDIKHIDMEQHKILTGRTNANILDMARYLSETGKPVWIRHVLVPERNDDDKYLEKLYDFISTLKNVQKVEVLPYHTFGEYKWKELDMIILWRGLTRPRKSGLQMRTASFIQGNRLSGLPEQEDKGKNRHGSFCHRHGHPYTGEPQAHGQDCSRGDDQDESTEDGYGKCLTGPVFGTQHCGCDDIDAGEEQAEEIDFHSAGRDRSKDWIMVPVKETGDRNGKKEDQDIGNR